MTDTHLTARGAETRQALLQAARTQFIDGGYAKFSLRAVAGVCGVSLGHLQHFFPTKTSLVMAMLKEASQEYVAAYQGFTASLELDPHERLLAVLAYLIDDARSERTVRFFVELWSVTVRDDMAHELLRELYRFNRTAFSPFIAAVRPDLTSQQTDSVSRTVIALIDGLIVYVQSERPGDAEFAAAAADTTAAALRVIGLDAEGLA